MLIGSLVSSLFRLPTNLKKIYHSAFELTYSAWFYLSNQKIIPKHFTKSDRKNYQEWILDKRTLISEINGHKLETAQLPAYMILNGDEDFPAPQEDYNINSLKQMRKDGINDRRNAHAPLALYDYVEKINSVILKYNEQQRNIREAMWSARFFGMGADDTKLNPENMILKFLYIHLNEVVSGYSNKVQELERLELLNTYVHQILISPSLKGDKQHVEFRKLLLVVHKHLVAAKKELTARVNSNQLLEKLNFLVDRTRGLIADVLVFLFNIFNFNNFQSAHLEKDLASSLAIAPQNKMNKWLQELVDYSREKLSLNESCVEYEKTKVAELSCDTLQDDDQVENIMSAVIPPIKERLTSRNFAIEWQSINNIQQKTLELVITYKLSAFLLHRIESVDMASRLSDVRSLNRLMDIILIKSDNLLQCLDNITSWQEGFNQFAIVEPSAWKTTKTNNLSDLMSLLAQSSTNLKEQAKICAERLATISSKSIYGYTDEEPDQSIKAIINLLIEPSNLHGQNLVTLNEQIKLFLESLKINDVFNPQLKMILEQYFTISDLTRVRLITVDGAASAAAAASPASDVLIVQDFSGDAHDFSVRHNIALRSEQLDLSHNPSFVYYVVLIQILIKVLEQPEMAVDQKTQIVLKFKSFLISNFILHDRASVSYFFDLFISTKYQAQLIQEQNSAFRKLIEGYFASYLQIIHNYIDQYSTVVPSSDYSLEVVYPKNTANRLENFTARMMHWVMMQSQLSRQLLKDSQIKPTDEQLDLSQQISINININAQILEILTNLLSLVSDLHAAYLAFEQNYCSLIQAQSPDDVQKLLTNPVRLAIDQIHPHLTELAKVTRENKSFLNNAQQTINRRAKTALTYLVRHQRDFYLSISNFHLRKHLIFDLFSHQDTLMQHVAVAYIHKMITENDLDEKLLLQLNKLINYIKIQKKSMSVEFSQFIDNVSKMIISLLGYNCSSEAVSELVICRWNPKLLLATDLNALVQHQVGALQEQLETVPLSVGLN